jgi:hypothetical protein
MYIQTPVLLKRWIHYAKYPVWVDHLFMRAREMFKNELFPKRIEEDYYDDDSNRCCKRLPSANPLTALKGVPSNED